jgi:iron-sulfur cluster repair protein YtfE (RIC family)
VLRDKSLIPLSHQHQHALALCVRIDRASPIPSDDLGAWQAEIAQIVQSEILLHFTSEERLIFPVARGFEELIPLVEELLADHASLRGAFTQAQAGQMSAGDLSGFAERLSAHIRKEERKLFERLQQLLSKEQLATLGKQLNDALKDAEQVCIVPSEATRLRSRE